MIIRGVVRPPHESVPLGELAVFTCYVYDYYKIDWRFSKGKMPPNIKFNTKGRQRELIIDKVEVYNVGTYTCTMEKDMLIYEGNGELSLSGKHLLKLSAVP